MLTRTKPQKELGTRRCMKPPPKEAFWTKGAWWNIGQNKNTNSKTEKAKEKALKWSIQIGKEPYRNYSEKNRAYKMLKETTKPLRRRVPIEEGLAKSAKKKHSENTDKWHLCKAGSFSYGESPRTPPLEGTSLHRWNNSVERPWGILSLFTTCLHLCEITLPQGVTCGLPLKSTLKGEKH